MLAVLGPLCLLFKEDRGNMDFSTDTAYKHCKSTKLASKKSLDQGVWAKQAKWFASHIGALVLGFFWLVKQGNQRKCEVLEFV